MTHGTPEAVAARMTALISPWGSVSKSDRWMPQGFDQREEAQLHKATVLVSAAIRHELARWWLPSGRERAMTPNIDIASTCTIGGRAGLLLVEAKAHAEELHKEAAGRIVDHESSEDRRASHGTIGNAIDEARRALSQATGLAWGISRDTHYQLSNRVAWAWKLATLGIPVVLVYLGFVQAQEMTDKGPPFADLSDWERVVREHAEGIVPRGAWSRSWDIDGTPMILLVCATQVPLPGWEF